MRFERRYPHLLMNHVRRQPFSLLTRAILLSRYLSGGRTPGVRARSGPDRFAEFVEYCRLRLAADPHVWATTLFDEVAALGYAGSYPSFTRAIRVRKLRPVCAACKQAKTVD